MPLNPYPQNLIIDNYNMLAAKLSEIGLQVAPLNPTGVCAGLDANFLFYMKQGRIEEFSLMLDFIAGLNKSIVDQFINYYLERRQLGKSAYIEIKPKQEAAPGIPARDAVVMDFEKIIQFLTAIQLAQENQFFKNIRANWDNSVTLMCPISELASQLNQTDLEDKKEKFDTDGRMIEDPPKYFSISLGFHRFSIYKESHQYYLFEPNDIPQFDPTRADNIQEIYQTSSLSALADRITTQYLTHRTHDLHKKEEPHIALTVNTLSYGEHKIDELMVNHTKLIHADPELTALFNAYQKGSLARTEVIVALLEALSHTPRFDQEHMNFVKALIDLARDLKIDNEIKLQHEIAQRYAHSTGSVKHISPLFLAVANNQINFVKELLKQKANPNETTQFHPMSLLTVAILDNNTEVALLLLKYGANPKMKHHEKALTPLHEAASIGNLSIIQALLKAGAEVNEKNNPYGLTPLHYAMTSGKAEVIQFLLEHGANPNLPDKSGNVPLPQAIRGNRLDLVHLLLQHTADPNLSCFVDHPLPSAAMFGGFDMIKILVEKKAGINATMATEIHELQKLTDKNNEQAFTHLFAGTPKELKATALHLCVLKGDLESVKFLLAHGANKDVTIGKNIKAFDIARALGYQEMMDLLYPTAKKTFFSHHVPKSNPAEQTQASLNQGKKSNS